MRYLPMIYTDETVEANMSPEEKGAYMAAYNAFTKATRDRNAFLAGEGAAIDRNRVHGARAQ
jgi:hypothetical protein